MDQSTASTLERMRPTAAGCPDELLLDELHHGELSAQRAEELQRHVAGCSDCQRRMELRRAAFDAFPQVDARRLAAATHMRVVQDAHARDAQPRWSWGGLRKLLWMATPAMAVAAVAIVVITRPHTGTLGRVDGTSTATGVGQEPGDTVREKGGLQLHVLRQQADGAQSAQSGDMFHAGDRVRFVIDLPAPGHVNVLGVEADGGMYVAWPSAPGVATLRDAGRAQVLPGAVELDGRPGRETLYLVRCPQAAGVPATQCRVSTGSSGGMGQLGCPPGCSTTAFVLNKS